MRRPTPDYSHWYNDEGEPMMDGAAMRFEAQLDAESAYDDYYDDGGYV